VPHKQNILTQRTAPTSVVLFARIEALHGPNCQNKTLLTQLRTSTMTCTCLSRPAPTTQCYRLWYICSTVPC